MVVCVSYLSIRAIGLINKPLKVTHGQWLYRNVHVLDTILGIIAERGDIAGDRKNNISLLKMGYCRRITICWK